MSDSTEFSAHTLTAAGLAAMLCASDAQKGHRRADSMGSVSTIAYVAQPTAHVVLYPPHRTVLLHWRLDKALYATPSQLPLVGDEVSLQHCGPCEVYRASLTNVNSAPSSYWLHRQGVAQQRSMAILRVCPYGMVGVRWAVMQPIAPGGCFTYLAEAAHDRVARPSASAMWLRLWQVKMVGWMIDLFAQSAATRGRLLHVEELKPIFPLLRLCEDNDDASESERDGGTRGANENTNQSPSHDACNENNNNRAIRVNSRNSSNDPANIRRHAYTSTTGSLSSMFRSAQGTKSATVSRGFVTPLALVESAVSQMAPSGQDVLRCYDGAVVYTGSAHAISPALPAWTQRQLAAFEMHIAHVVHLVGASRLSRLRRGWRCVMQRAAAHRPGLRRSIAGGSVAMMQSMAIVAQMLYFDLSHASSSASSVVLSNSQSLVSLLQMLCAEDTADDGHSLRHSGGTGPTSDGAMQLAGIIGARGFGALARAAPPVSDSRTAELSSLPSEDYGMPSVFLSTVAGRQSVQLSNVHTTTMSTPPTAAAAKSPDPMSDNRPANPVVMVAIQRDTLRATCTHSAKSLPLAAPHLVISSPENAVQARAHDSSSARDELTSNDAHRVSRALTFTSALAARYSRMPQSVSAWLRQGGVVTVEEEGGGAAAGVGEDDGAVTSWPRRGPGRPPKQFAHAQSSSLTVMTGSRSVRKAATASFASAYVAESELFEEDRGGDGRRRKRPRRGCSSNK